MVELGGVGAPKLNAPLFPGPTRRSRGYKRLANYLQELRREKTGPSSGFPTWSDTNQPVQL